MAGALMRLLGFWWIGAIALLALLLHASGPLRYACWVAVLIFPALDLLRLFRKNA